MSELFSSSEPLRSLQALTQRHLNINEPLAGRIKELPGDIEKEVDYF
jgi:hypothetical protein